MAMNSERRILFVYNADSPLLAQLKGYVHKIVAPDTYPCSLCRITYGNLGMKRAWRRFARELPCPAVFLHRDELAVDYPQLLEIQLPAVFMDEGGAITQLVSANALDQTPDVAALQDLVMASLAEYAPAAPAKS